MMKRAEELKIQQQKERKRTVISLLVAALLVIAGVFAFIRYYNSYIDGTLYAERLNQMREVTTQLFSGLEDVVKGQWRTVETQHRSLQRAQPQTWDDLYAFMEDQAYQSDLESIQCNIVAVDVNGAYYTQNGRQGLMPERDYLNGDPERISYVTNSLISDESRMVFLKRLEQPVTLQDDDGPITLCYYGISQNMEQLNPYFECSAYSGHSSVYVVDESGLKLFSSSSSGDLLKGYNVFNTLKGMSYLHGSNFDDAASELENNNLAYSNALLGDMEIYYSLYKMDNSEWTLIFLVPSQYVAANTVELVNVTIRLVLIFAVTLIVISVALVFWMLKKQQKMTLEVERRNSETLEHMNVQLQAASKAKTDFLANMSHDIRTPMNAIVGITKLMAHDKNDPVKIDGYIHKVQQSSQHLLSLINDVLDMSKIESGEVTLNTEPISLADQVGQIESIVRPQIEERRQKLTVRTHNITHEHLVGDAVRLRQVFINLLSNAIKYTPNGGSIALDLEELPCDTPDHARLRIAVTDSGYGMSPEFLAHIFEPFTRAENSTTNRVQGTGLGMAITKNIVDLAGGTISVESEVDKGSCFTVELPFLIDHDAKTTLPIRSALLITDERSFIENAQAAFKETDVTLLVAKSEAEVDETLQTNKPDMILLSSHLNGDTLANNVQRLRKNAGNALLVYCCDYDEREHLPAISENGGVDGVLARPFFLSNLAAAIERVHSSAPATEEENSSILNGKRFLCAEDNSLNAEILQAVLDMNGASCVIYPDGQQIVDAFAAVKEGDFDAILMDVQMPVMNGLDATREIRRSENPLGKTIPIIAMTANAFSEDVQNCLNAGMDAHVSKPLDIAALERTLKSVAGGKFSGGGGGPPPARVLGWPCHVLSVAKV